MEQVREGIQKKHYSIRAEKSFADWIKRYIFFHDKRHSNDLGETQISQFLPHLAVNGKVAASRRNQALDAIVFRYKKQVLKIEPGQFEDDQRVRKPAKLPAGALPFSLFDEIIKSKRCIGCNSSKIRRPPRF